MELRTRNISALSDGIRKFYFLAPDNRCRGRTNSKMLVLMVIVSIVSFGIYLVLQQRTDHVGELQGLVLPPALPGSQKKVTEIGTQRIELETLESLLAKLSEMRPDEELSKMSAQWMNRAAEENPELAFKYLLERSGQPWDDELAEKFVEKLGPDMIYDFIAKGNGRLSEQQVTAMKRSAYLYFASTNAVEAVKLAASDVRLTAEERPAALGLISVKMPHTQVTADLLISLSDQSVTGSALGTTMSYWAGKEPEAAGAWLRQHLNNPNQERLARALVQNWAKKDVMAAADWVNSLPSGVAKETGTIYVAQTMVPVDPEAGLKWAEEIKHPKWREVLSQQAKELIAKGFPSAPQSN